ncbi:ATP-dependent Clp protease ATP-binding subunit [Fervidibacillus halotolerans]|uniref:ATP-dependent Clp protease ATP-binding subunit n=1 Tax=Fervidibacillus halotolerans TaxID=2980027 RepID=A0A9E8M0L0_9BACI|nr:ATP-dependent Clp protease ATP-binding subunit [Fervidibacillus halotolerans]WAA13210.1 ATP-dependent Clp protease ATP-binding subunit [Fervidibacillus halotolerans]
MLCQKCQQNEATVHLRYEINGEQTTYHLCQQCYRQQQESFSSEFQAFFSSGSPFEQFFNNFSNGSFSSEPFGSNVTQKVQTTGGKRNGFLDHFGKNVTDEARRGKIDPVIGRDDEIQKVMEILNRRNKNNPVLIGEPGVGKTAVVEGLALKIVSGNVPMKLRNKEVYVLDVASLVANTGIRGQFEERMKQLIHELQNRQDVILFIDEIHLIVGAGSAEGSMDAGNILKPALARGDIQIIGATTIKEYRQIEKDAALERRFQPVLIQEPSIDASIHILMGLKERYEKYHQVKYTDEAIRACVNLSHRYIQDRFLPDKAIDLMDEAGSKVNLKSPNFTSKQVEERLQQITVEKKKALQEENYEWAAKLRDEENELKNRRKNDAGNDLPVVDIQVIHDILEEKTGIPVGKIQADEQQKLKNLEQNLAKKVIGQSDAVRAVAKAIRRGRAGLKAKNRPIGSFLFVGPTGVGKTELAKTLAEELYGTRDSLIRLDMSEYMEKHSVSKLIGSPPGYVGHEEAGQLTEKVRRNPYSLILLDEIEKAHPDVMHMFLQILDDGRLTDSQGRTVSFKDTVIIMTSNAGTERKLIQVGFDKREDHDKTSLMEQLRQYFKPEFLNRFDDIIRFHHLDKEHLLQIVDLMLNEVKMHLNEEHIELTVDDNVKEKLVEIGYNRDFGARPLRRTIQEQLEDRIADYILDHPETKQLKATLVDDKISISA